MQSWLRENKKLENQLPNSRRDINCHNQLPVSDPLSEHLWRRLTDASTNMAHTDIEISAYITSHHSAAQISCDDLSISDCLINNGTIFL